MQYMIVCHGPRLAGYGPFDTESDARNHADKYFQDYRTEIIDYSPVVVPEVGRPTKSEILANMAKLLGIPVTEVQLTHMDPADLGGYLGVPGKGKSGSIMKTSTICDRCYTRKGVATWHESHSCYLCEECFAAMEADMGADNADHE